MKKLIVVLVMLVSFVGYGQQVKADKEVLEALLLEFLANVSAPSMHDRFWADDLVYTSSSGRRYGKEKIMAGLSGQPAVIDPDLPKYGAEDVRIRVFGEMAVVDFTLVSSVNEVVNQRFLNSGTFIKRNGTWQVINWQATTKAAD